MKIKFDKIEFKEITKLKKNQNFFFDEIRKCYNFFVKKNLFLNNHIVSEKDHKIWIRNLLKNKSERMILAIENKKTFLGYIRAKKYYNYFIISIAILPKIQKKKIGSKLLKKLIEHTKERSAKFIAIVKKKNIHSREFFKKNKFKMFESELTFFNKFSKKNYIFIFSKKNLH